MSTHDTYVTPPLGPEPSAANARIALQPLPSPALKPRATSLLPLPKSSFVTDHQGNVRGKTVSRFAPDHWSELSDDIYHCVAESVPTHDLPSLSRTSKRWRRMVEAAWPAICERRWPMPRPPLMIPNAVMWAVATRGDDDERIRTFLRTLTYLQREWPDAFCTNCDHAGGINNRLAELRGKTSWRLPADAALFWLLGASLEGSSPCGTTSGDFGPEYEATTPREPWRVALAWESLASLDSEPPLSLAAAGGAQPQVPVMAFQEAVLQMANAADAAADVAAPEDTAPQSEAPGSIEAASAPAPAPAVPSYELQSLQMLNEYWEAQVEDTALDTLNERGAHLLQVANLVTDKAAGTCSMLFIDCQPPGAGAHGGAAASSSAAVSSSSTHSERKRGTAWMVVLSGDEDDGDYRFECSVNGEPLSLTTLLELMLGALRSRPDCRGLRWQEAWRRVDLYEYICGAFDAPEDDGMSSIVDDGEGSSDSEEDEGSGSDDDSYPASMLAGDDDDDDLVHDPALEGHDQGSQPDSDPAAQPASNPAA